MQSMVKNQNQRQNPVLSLEEGMVHQVLRTLVVLFASEIGPFLGSLWLFVFFAVDSF